MGLPEGVHWPATAFSSEPLLEGSATQVASMPSPQFKLMALLLSLIALFGPVSPNVFFPVETSQEAVHYRSLKDVLFRPHSGELGLFNESPVVASFRPSDPSPTLASSPQTGVGVSKIRFLEADEFFVPSLFQASHPRFFPVSRHTEGRSVSPLSSDVDSTTLVRQAKSAPLNTSAEAVPVAEASVLQRWPWPYSRPNKQPTNPQSRQLQQAPALTIKKSVAKPYRLLTRKSSCPKLLHDLTISCTLPKQLSSQLVV